MDRPVHGWSGGGGPSRVLPRRKEFVVQDLEEENRKLKLRLDLLTRERDELVKQVEEYRAGGAIPFERGFAEDSWGYDPMEDDEPDTRGIRGPG